MKEVLKVDNAVPPPVVLSFLMFSFSHILVPPAVFLVLNLILQFLCISKPFLLPLSIGSGGNLEQLERAPGHLNTFPSTELNVLSIPFQSKIQNKKYICN